MNTKAEQLFFRFLEMAAELHKEATAGKQIFLKDVMSKREYAALQARADYYFKPRKKHRKVA